MMIHLPLATAAAGGAAAAADDRTAALLASIDERLTVEGHLDAQRDVLLAEVDNYVEELVARLREQLEAGKESIRAAMKQGKGGAEGGGAAREKGEMPQAVRLLAHTGPYEGQSWVLRPTARRACMLGRSTGKRFRDGGMSMPDDVEVSTTHAKVTVGAGGVLCFEDAGSTNGTVVGGVALEQGVPVELCDGMRIIMGNTTLEATLLTGA